MSKLARLLKVQPRLDAKNEMDVSDVAQNKTHLLLPIESCSKLYQWPCPCRSTIAIKIASKYQQTLASSQTRAHISKLRQWANLNATFHMLAYVCTYLRALSFTFKTSSQWWDFSLRGEEECSPDKYSKECLELKSWLHSNEEVYIPN